MSGSVWLLPAAGTTLQWVEGKKSLWSCPSLTRVFTLTVVIKIAEEKQAARKNPKFRAARAQDPFLKESNHHAF
jgi:hypothetical protein